MKWGLRDERSIDRGGFLVDHLGSDAVNRYLGLHAGLDMFVVSGNEDVIKSTFVRRTLKKSDDGSLHFTDGSFLELTCLYDVSFTLEPSHDFVDLEEPAPQLRVFDFSFRDGEGSERALVYARHHFEAFSLVLVEGKMDAYKLNSIAPFHSHIIKQDYKPRG